MVLRNGLSAGNAHNRIPNNTDFASGLTAQAGFVTHVHSP